MIMCAMLHPNHDPCTTYWWCSWILASQCNRLARNDATDENWICFAKPDRREREREREREMGVTHVTRLFFVFPDTLHVCRGFRPRSYEYIDFFLPFSPSFHPYRILLQFFFSSPRLYYDFLNFLFLIGRWYDDMESDIGFEGVEWVFVVCSVFEWLLFFLGWNFVGFEFFSNFFLERLCFRINFLRLIKV